ncbi:MAG: hypothetical protein Q9178_005322 [Gyalolechia marmorata]
MKKRSVKEKPTKGLTVEGLHSMLSERLFHVPDIRSFRQALGAPPGMFVIEAFKPEPRPVKPDAGSINARSSRWQAWKGDRILFISIPRSKRNNTNDYNEIQVRASHGEASNEDTNVRIPIVLDPTKFGLPLQFPTVEIRNTACYNLRSHLLKFDNDDAFQLVVSESDQPWRFVLPVLEVHTDEALSLLAIVVRFLSFTGHSPLYTFHFEQPRSADKSLPVAAACCPIWLLEESNIPDNEFAKATSNVFLSASCTSRCSRCPQTVNIVECNLPRQ